MHTLKRAFFCCRFLPLGLLAVIVVPPSATDAYVEERCSAGQRLKYWTFAGRDHFTIVQPGTSLEKLLIGWTTARFANEPQASGCVHKSF